MSKQVISQLKNFSDEDMRQLERLESELFPHDAWDKTALSDVFSQDYNYFFVVKIDDDIIGFCIVQVMFDTAEILQIGVDSEFQGHGFAKQLLQNVIDFLQTTESEKLLLEVRADNMPAIRLYQSFGFYQIHTRKNYYKNQDNTATDALILQKALG